MSLFEWWAEQFNPGETATVEYGRGYKSRAPAAFKILKFLVFNGFVGIGLYYLYTEVLVVHFRDSLIQALGVTGSVLFLYVLLAYMFRPKLPADNMGWFGGLIDDPTRISDDYNRMVFFFSLLLLPGRLVGESIVDVWELVYDSLFERPEPVANDPDLPISDEDDPFAEYLPNDHPARAKRSDPSALALVGIFMIVLGLSFGLVYILVLRG
jgi:hypothetical protein